MGSRSYNVCSLLSLSSVDTNDSSLNYRLPYSERLAASPAHLRSNMVEALVKLAMGFESDIFSWDREGDCFDWRMEGRDKKGKGREVDEETVRGRIWGSDIESSER